MIAVLGYYTSTTLACAHCGTVFCFSNVHHTITLSHKHNKHIEPLLEKDWTDTLKERNRRELYSRRKEKRCANKLESQTFNTIINVKYRRVPKKGKYIRIL